MTPEELSRRIINRIYTINRKLPTCKGYTPEEKEIRLEELNWVLEYVDGFRTTRVRRGRNV